MISEIQIFGETQNEPFKIKSFAFRNYYYRRSPGIQTRILNAWKKMNTFHPTTSACIEIQKKRLKRILKMRTISQ
jgi:hypothetical protein